MKKIVLFSLLTACITMLSAQSYQLSGPDNNITLTVNTEEVVSFSVDYKDTPVIANSTVSLSLNGLPVIGKAPKAKDHTENHVSNVLTPVIARKSSVILNEYNELMISFKQDYRLTFRVYNDGVAYRFSTSLKNDVTVNSEGFDLHFAGNAFSLFPEEESLISHNERFYLPAKPDTLKESAFCSLPVYIKVNGVHILLTEADLYDYPGMFMYGTEGNSLKAGFPGYVAEARPLPGSEDRDQELTYAPWIAKTKGTRHYPWRVMIISDQDETLLESELVYQLSSPLRLENTDWIKPGKVAWDWYNANNIYGVDFKAGINTETYKYYIDFASQYGIEYVILDEGWTKTSTNIREPNPDMDVHELIAYGKQKNVGIILWVLWGPLDRDMDVLELYKNWGAKGVKVDFMQRNDQYMVNFYERVAAKAAENRLLVDFHGAYKPSGLRRAYPNVISYEGVKGNENNKWSHEITPEHNVTLPFTRMAAGPMDYTPGAMVNAVAGNHRISFFRPMSLGTRCHQIAMYVVYESPLQMLCDAPSAYLKEEETAGFISKIPVVWDETRVLDAAIADYVLIARKKDDVWYVGAMTDWTPREMELDLSFLKDGDYTMEVMRDGINADRYAQDYVYEVLEVKNTDKLTVKLTAGGGWAAILSRIPGN